MSTCEHCGKTLVRKRYAKRAGGSSLAKPKRFCDRRCAMQWRNRNASGRIDKHGYRVLPSGSRAGQWRYEHRVVMETMIGRKLMKHETVHHKNGDRLDNRPENLELWISRHGRGQRAAEVTVCTGNNFVLGALSLGA